MRKWRNPFVVGCGFFLLVKAFYLIYGWSELLVATSFEDTARFAASYRASWLHPFADGTAWLPLHSFLHWLAIQIGRDNALFWSSLCQTILSSLGGIVAALIAMHLGRHWLAGLATLAAWIASPCLSLMGIGQLSEITFHLAMLLAIYLLLRLPEETEEKRQAKWRIGFLAAIIAMELTRYEGWVMAFFLCAWWGVKTPSTPPRTSSGVARLATMAVLVSAVPVVWILTSGWITGDYAFIYNYHDQYPNFECHNFHFLGIGALNKLLHDGLEFQPHVVIATLALLLFLRIKATRGNGLILYTLITTIATLWFFSLRRLPEYGCPVNRIPATIYVLLCSLFGICVQRAAENFKIKPRHGKPEAVLAWSLIFLGFLGVMNFMEQPSFLKAKTDIAVSKDIRRLVKKDFSDLPGRKPTIAVDLRKYDYGIVYLATSKSVKYVWFKTDPELAKLNPRPDFILTMQENVPAGYQIASQGQQWRLYQFRR